MAGFISVKNFERFQHYKDRNPKWIKLYNDVLDDYAFGCLPDASKWLAVGIWLLASRHENRIPNDLEWIGRRINASEPVDLGPLLSAEFITVSQPASKPLALCPVPAMPEGEGERELETTTGDKSPEGKPRDFQPVEELDAEPEPTTEQPPVEQPDSKVVPIRKSAPVDPALHDHRKEATTLILEKLWQGSRDNPPLRFGRTWSLANELSIWNELAKHEPPEEVNGAIGHMRRVGEFGATEPLSLRLFHSKDPNSRTLYAACLQAYRVELQRDATKVQMQMGGIMDQIMARRDASA